MYWEKHKYNSTYTGIFTSGRLGIAKVHGRLSNGSDFASEKHLDRVNTK